MKRFLFKAGLIVFALSLVIPAAGCAEDDGNTGPAERIISLAPGNTEILYALGLGENVVGVTEFCNYPPEAKQNPTVGGFSTIDLEKVIELDPDLVLATGIHEETVVPQLEDRGIDVFVMEPRSLDEVLMNIALVGVKTGRQEESNVLVTDIESRIEAIQDKVSSAERRPSVFYVTWHDPIWTLGKGTLTHELIQTAGGNNLFGDMTGHLETNLEAVISRNPDVILASTGHGTADDSPVIWAQTEERLRDVNARLNDQVYEVDSDLVTRSGPRIVDGLELMAKYIHPELFEE